MNRTHVAGQPTKRGDPKSFDGTAWQQTLAVSEGAHPLHVSRVTFEPGSRTVWHVHPFGQILIATSGLGRFQVAGGPVLVLRPGDSVTVPPAEKHWHGAAPDQLFVHTSIQAADGNGEQATWLEPVTNETYSATPTE